MKRDLNTLAAAFRQLHKEAELLTLVNAWDAGTARLIESVGAKAIATTSAGVAWSHGYPDGDKLPTDLLLTSVKNMARAVQVPLTVDIEGGYSKDLNTVTETVTVILDAGAVGINIEDGDDSPDLLCGKIERVKQVGIRLGVDVFVNARTDVYLRGLAPEDERVAEVLRRAERYRAAGADGLFVPCVTATHDIAMIAAGTGLPFNVLAWAGLPSAAELKRLGVRRLSAGSGLIQTLYDLAKSLTVDFLGNGDSAAIAAEGTQYVEINNLML